MSTYGFQSVTRFIGKQKQNQYSGFESLSKTCIYFINLKKYFFWLSVSLEISTYFPQHC